MTVLDLRQYLKAHKTDDVRSCCGTGEISFRNLISSFSQPIYEKWQSLGGADGKLGAQFGVKKQLVMDGHNIDIQQYVHGSIVDLGNGIISAGLGGAGGGGLLPETPYRLTLEKVSCGQRTQGETLEGYEDELWAKFVFTTNRAANSNNLAIYQGDYHNDHITSGNTYTVDDCVIYEGSLPEIFNLSLLAVEVDDYKDAQELMAEYVTRLSQDLGSWFTPGNDETESRLAFNILANKIITGVLMAAGDIWTKITTSIMGPTMEALLTGLQNWYKADLIGALSYPPLGDFLTEVASGNLPAEEPLQEVTILGYTSGTSLVVKHKYTLCDDGSILEDCRFVGGASDADYTFTLRHWFGNNNNSKAPDRQILLSISSTNIALYDGSGHDTGGGHCENELSFDTNWTEYGYYLEKSVNGEPFWLTRVENNTSGKTKIFLTEQQLWGGGEETVSYKVRAYNQSGFGSYSNMVVSILPFPSAPPYGLSALKTPTSPGTLNVHIYWMDDCDDNIQYHLERSRSGGEFIEFAFVSAKKPSTRGGNKIDTVSESFVGEKIAYRIRSENKYGLGQYSEILEITV